jgi:hypothetical protein
MHTHATPTVYCINLPNVKLNKSSVLLRTASDLVRPGAGTIMAAHAYDTASHRRYMLPGGAAGTPPATIVRNVRTYRIREVIVEKPVYYRYERCNSELPLPLREPPKKRFIPPPIPPRELSTQAPLETQALPKIPAHMPRPRPEVVLHPKAKCICCCCTPEPATALATPKQQRARRKPRHTAEDLGIGQLHALSDTSLTGYMLMVAAAMAGAGEDSDSDDVAVIEVVCPHGSKPGDLIDVRLPISAGGMIVKVSVPTGARPGSKFEIRP